MIDWLIELRDLSLLYTAQRDKAVALRRTTAAGRYDTTGDGHGMKQGVRQQSARQTSSFFVACRVALSHDVQWALEQCSVYTSLSVAFQQALE